MDKASPDKMLTFAALFPVLEANFNKGLSLIKEKNQDYATPQDFFKNFRGVELIGLTVEQGILTRMMDKVARTANLLNHPPAVADESIEDTALDLMNYAAILLAYLQTKNS